MGQELKPTPPAPFVVDGAAIGCCYAQAGSMTGYKDLWDKRHLRILHNDSEKQCGLEMAHNYDCVPVKNVPKFNICKSPYYYETVGILKSLYPDNEDYAKGFESYCRINAKAEDGSPPCVGAFLDTWFNSSDIVIADKYQKFIKQTLFFISRMNENINEMKEWSEKEIKKYRKRAEREYRECISDLQFERGMSKLGSDLEKIREKDDHEKNGPNALERAAEEAKEYRELSDKMFHKYDVVERKVKKLYERGKRKVERWDRYIDAIQVYEGDYCKTLEKLANEIEAYRKGWSDALSEAEIDMNSQEASSFFYYCDQMVSDARKLAADGADDKRIGKALLTSSFLICKCGGKIEFLDSGQERALYCQTLYKQVVKLLENALAYQEEILAQNGKYAGVVEWESTYSVKVTRWVLQEVLEALHDGRDFKLYKLAGAVKIRLITKSYKEEQREIMDEVVGILLLKGADETLGKIEQIGSAVMNGIELGTTISDTKDILEQTELEQKKNELDDAVTMGTEWGGHLTGLIGGIAGVRSVKGMIGEMPAKLCEVTGNALEAIGWITSVGTLFYTSDKNWIEEIEITVFTKYMAHIIRQSYNENMTPKKSFDGPSMVRAKPKRDYICDSVGNVDWDELKGIIFGVKEHVMKEELSKNVDGKNEVTESMDNYYKN